MWLWRRLIYNTKLDGVPDREEDCLLYDILEDLLGSF